MAAVRDPEEVLSPRSEKDNFHRLTRLLISGGTQLLREIFDSRCPPRVLPGILNNPVKKNQLKAAKLTKPQRDCLYPSPGTCGKSEDFDVTLLFRLLRTICSLTPPTTGWDALPASTDHSLEADLARIKHYRNSVYGHVNQNMKITDDEFLQLWKEISQALVRIAGQISPIKKREWQKAIDNFLKNPLTAEDERNVQELQKWYKEDMNIKESIEKLEDTTQKGISLIESLNQSMEEFMKCMNEFRGYRRISCPNCNEVDVALLPLTVSCVAITQPDQRGETQGMARSGNCPPPTAQEVLNLASQKYLQTINPSKPEELNGFLQYLRDVRQLLFVDVKDGSLIITVGCRSLQILEDLWKDYCTGRLNEMAQKYLVTKELLNELGLTEAKLTTSISEKEYRSCRNQLSVYGGLEQKIKQLKKHRDALEDQFFNWGDRRMRPTGALQTETSRGTSIARSVGMAALLGGTVVILFTFGMSVVYGEAVATAAVAAVATGAAGAAGAAVFQLGVFEGFLGRRSTCLSLIGAAAAAAAAFGWKAALVGAAIALSFIFGMSVVYSNASATGAVEAVAAGTVAGAVVAIVAGVVRVARDKTKLLILQREMVLLRLKSKVDPLKHCVADLAVYCREHADQVLSSRLMAREFPFLRDILLEQEAEFRTIKITSPALLTRVTKLSERRGNGEEISTVNLYYELTEVRNDEEIRAMIMDFIEKEFAFFFLSSDYPSVTRSPKLTTA